MSSLSQFAPFAGGGLKSYQTGFVFGSTSTGSPNTEDAYYYDITVSSVSTTKSMPNVFGGTSTSANQVGTYYAGAVPTGIVLTRLTSSTNLRLSTATNQSYSFSQISARWQIAEAN